MERGRVYDLVDGDRDAAVQSGHRRRGNYGLAELYPHQRYLADRLPCAVAGKRPDSHAAILRGDARGQGDHPAFDSAWRGGHPRAYVLGPGAVCAAEGTGKNGAHGDLPWPTALPE